MTGENWMKAFVLHLIKISHLQWIFCNFTLHNKQRGHLSLLKWATVLKEVDRLLDTAPEDIPAGSQYLLELDYSALYNASLERQSYWVLAMKAACRAGKRDATASKRRGRSQRKLRAKASTRKPRYNFSREEAWLQHELRISRPSWRLSRTGPVEGTIGYSWLDGLLRNPWSGVQTPQVLEYSGLSVVEPLGRGSNP
jgi:hypothetical protein